jgi:cell division protein FtsL
MEEIITVLQNFGFPVSVAIFLLISFQKTIQGSTNEICKMIEKMIEVKNALDNLKEEIRELQEDIRINNKK